MLKFEVSFFSILSVIKIKQSNLINIQINDYNHYHYFDDALKLFFHRESSILLSKGQYSIIYSTKFVYFIGYIYLYLTSTSVKFSTTDNSSTSKHERNMK